MKIYFIGIKGSGMSALAQLIKDLGHDVLGSDVEKIFFTDEKLKNKKIKVLSFDEKNIDETIDYVIVGNAFNEDNIEVQKAKKLNIKIIKYYECLKYLSINFDSIAISGTNGKTTTTSMVTNIFPKDNINYIIGDGTGHGHIDATKFIFEACEYKNTFLNYKPKTGIITNIEMDHPDFFKSLNDVINSYQEFANKINNLIINDDDLNIKKIKHNNIFTFSIKNKKANVYLEIKKENESNFIFNLYLNQEYLGEYSLPFVGTHMIYNSLAAISIGLFYGLSSDQIIENLNNFEGAKRRFEIYKFEKQDIFLIDDYAHHPTSIKYTLEAIKKKYPDYKLTCFFQAHTYSRVKIFCDDFAEALAIADNIYVDKIFGSIRENNSDINEKVLIDALAKYNKNIINDCNQIKNIGSKQVIALLGAGDIDVNLIPKIKEIINEINN